MAKQPADLPIMTGAQALVTSLERCGVEVAFGIPGGAILPAYDPLFDSSIRHILVRHEQGAGHAAEGYYDEVSGMVRRNPAQALGIAAGLGFLVGLILARR